MVKTIWVLQTGENFGKTKFGCNNGDSSRNILPVAIVHFFYFFRTTTLVYKNLFQILQKTKEKNVTSKPQLLNDSIHKYTLLRNVFMGICMFIGGINCGFFLENY